MCFHLCAGQEQADSSTEVEQRLLRGEAVGTSCFGGQTFVWDDVKVLEVGGGDGHPSPGGGSLLCVSCCACVFSLSSFQETLLGR